MTEPGAHQIDDDGLIGDLLGTTERLTGLLDQETACARAGDRAGMEALEEEKLRLTERYENLIGALNEQPELLDEMDNETHQVLSECTQAFQESLNANQRALKIAMQVCDTVLKAGADAIKQAEQASSGYSQLGTQRPAPDAQAGVSLALNQRL